MHPYALPQTTKYFDILMVESLVTAIANYTTRVVDTSLSAAQRQEALKFIGACFLIYRFASFSYAYCNLKITYVATESWSFLLTRNMTYLLSVYWRHWPATPCRGPRSWWQRHRREM